MKLVKKDSAVIVSDIAQKEGQVSEAVLSPDIKLDPDLGAELCRKLGRTHKLFEPQVEEREQVKPFPFSWPESTCEEMIFYPGSFSPWHKGHSACVLNSPELPLVVIPDYNPWKSVRETNPWDEVRTIWRELEGLKLQNKEQRLSLYTGFLVKKEKNPTVSWLPEVKVAKKWLLMGEDSFLSLHHWRDVQTLLNSLYGLLVCPRDESKDEVKRQRDFIKTNFNKSLNIELLEDHPYQHFSSTYLREKGPQNGH